MATIRDELILDLSQAIGQLDDLERQLDSLLQPIDIPVTVDDSQVSATNLSRAEQATEELRRELGLTDDALEEVRREADRTGDELESTGTRGSKAFQGFGTAVAGVTAGLAAFVGARELIDFFRDSIEAASDLEESTSKAQVVFGSFFDDIEQFASTAPQALGLANQEALEFTATFGNLFTALGLSQEAAADLSPEIVQLGSDLASFNNIEVTEALDKLRAGLVGEAEPLRVLGVNLSAAATAAKAVELGLADSTSAVDDAAKVQARYALILEQTGTAQGDFARTADSTANQIRSFSAGVEQFQATVGEALIPALQGALDTLNDFLPAITAIAVEFGVITGAISQAEGDLRRFSAFSGQAEESATLLAGAINQTAIEVERAVKGLRDSEESTDLFTERIEGLVSAFKGGPQEVQKVIDNLDTLVEEFDLTEDQARIVARVLRDELTVAAAESADRVLLAVRDVRQATEEFSVAEDDLQRFADTVEATSERIARGFDFEELEREFAGLPTALGGARDALRDEENQIVEDFTDFLSNLEAELEAQAAFRENIAILRALGLDNLADVFTEEGLDAAAALADAVASPEEAARAESLLAQRAREEAQAYAEAFGTEVSEFVAAFDPLEIPVIPILGELDASALNFLNVNVGAGGPGGGGGERPTVVQNFYTEPTPTAETARAAQAANIIVGQPS